MEIKVEKAQKGEQKISIKLSELDYQKYYEQAIKKLSGQINVKGFRPGKIPKTVVEQHVKQEMIEATAADIAIPVTYTEAVKQEKIPAIGRPQVKVTKAMPLEYEALIPITPEVKVEGYKKIKLSKAKIEVNQEEIEIEINRMRKSQSKYKDADRPAQAGDRVEINFDGFDEGGAPLDNTSSKNHPLVIGDGSFVPGFEEQLVGMKKGDHKEIKVTFPADYFHEPFQNKVVVFKVKMVRHEIMFIPELNEEFVEKVTGNKSSVKDFKKQVQEQLQKTKEIDDKEKLQGELMTRVNELTKVDIHQSLIDEEVDYMIAQQKAEMKERGLDFSEYLNATQQSEQELRDSKKEEAMKRLRVRFGLQEIFKQEKIDVSDQEMKEALTKELEVMAAMNYKADYQHLQNLQNRLYNMLKLEKLVDSLTK